MWIEIWACMCCRPGTPDMQFMCSAKVCQQKLLHSVLPLVSVPDLSIENAVCCVNIMDTYPTCSRVWQDYTPSSRLTTTSCRLLLVITVTRQHLLDGRKGRYK